MTLVFEQGAMAYGNVRVSQLLSIMIILAAVALIVVRRVKGWAKEKYSDPVISTKQQANLDNN
jgi:phosphatidylglycerol:prolipoprotein diacylglycerol transferase